MKKKQNSILLFGILLTITITCNAQVSMVTDLQKDQNTAGSDPSLFVEMNGYLYFVATETTVGTELWRTDGTKAGTELVKDIVPGPGSSKISNLFVYNGNLYFTAIGSGGYSSELWKSDGTENGTNLMVVNNDDYFYNPQEFIIFQGSLYFQATDSNGTELCKTDGTDSGTVIVKDIFPDTAKKGVQNSSNPKNFLVVNGVLYFQAASKGIGTELWKSDGTKAGTMLVKDIYDTFNSDPRQLVDLNGTLYFAANNGTNGDELWKSNGTAAGTVMVKDIYPGAAGSSINFMTKYNNKLYFSADNGIAGVELWTSDGTDTVTKILTNIYPGADPSYPSLFTEYNGKLYFTANNGSAGYELWVTNGTLAGTIQLKDILLGSGGSEPALFKVVNNTLFFVAQNIGVGNELWKSDGTANGTVMVKDILPGTSPSNPRYFTAFKNMLIFGAEEVSKGRELLKSDGTDTGTAIIKDINNGTKSANPSQLVKMKTNIYFTAESSANGIELFKTDGTKTGTVVVKDIIPGIGSSTPKNLININDVLYFSADNSSKGNELWKSNGTQAGTSMVYDINQDVYASDPKNFCSMKGIIYFSADNGWDGFELWRSDGVVNGIGTKLLKDIFPGQGISSPNSSNPSGLVNVNNILYFAANDGIYGNELWRSDGTDTGTYIVKDIFTGMDTTSPNSSNPNMLVNINGTLFFRAYDSINGMELWKSGGTESSTMLVKDIFPDTAKGGKPNTSNPQYLTELNGMVYFQATNKVLGTELWRSDGTDTGTKLVKDIMPGSYKGFAYSSNPQYLTKVGNEIFFAATSPGKGNELWKTDGTIAGTVLFKDINPGYAGSNPNNLLADGPNLYFVANDGINGSELWKAENNQCGKTQMVGEINPGKTGTGPTNLCMLGSVVYFSATDAISGTELWKYVPVFTFADTSHFTYVLCSGDSVFVSDKYQYVKTVGIYKDSLKTAKSCDSLVITNVTVNPVYSKSSSASKCLGDSVKVGNNYIKATGTYYNNLLTKKGCDSILVYNLKFSPKPPTPIITKTGTIQLTSNAPTGNQWYDDNGKIITNGTSPVYTTNGKKSKYYVIVTIDSCSSDPSNKMDPLGINEKLVFSNIDIYPNPVSDKLLIEYTGSNISGYLYDINNIQGKTLLHGKLTVSKNEIDVSSLSRGIYFVKIIFEDKIGLIKIIKD